MKQMYAVMLTGVMLLTLTPAQSLFARGGGKGQGSVSSGTGSGSMKQYGTGTTNGARQSNDADGDGIANRQDSDYVRPQDETGRGTTDFKGSGTGTRVLDGTGPHGKKAQTAP